MKQQLYFFLLYVTFSTLAQEPSKVISQKDFSIGKTIELFSSQLGEIRELNIYLPNNYHEDSSKTYPVIYLLDGSRDEDFIHISGLVQFGSTAWVNMLPESIVVGIANVDRQRDFTYPTSVAEQQAKYPTTGNSEKFIQFIAKEVQPFIEATFNTDDKKTIIGQSLGGLLATEVLFKYPELFDNYMIVSPSLWWDNESLLDYKLESDLSSKAIYVAVGAEGDVMERTAKELFEKLKEGKSASSRIYFDFLADKNHGDALHQAVYNAFEKLFMPDKQ